MRTFIEESNFLANKVDEKKKKLERDRKREREKKKTRLIIKSKQKIFEYYIHHHRPLFINKQIIFHIIFLNTHLLLIISE